MILLVAVGLVGAMHQTLPAPALSYAPDRVQFSWQCWYWGQLEGSFGRRNGRWHFSDIRLKRVSPAA